MTCAVQSITARPKRLWGVECARFEFLQLDSMSRADGALVRDRVYW
jgi:hypothetical protein